MIHSGAPLQKKNSIQNKLHKWTMECWISKPWSRWWEGGWPAWWRRRPARGSAPTPGRWSEHRLDESHRNDVFLTSGTPLKPKKGRSILCIWLTGYQLRGKKGAGLYVGRTFWIALLEIEIMAKIFYSTNMFPNTFDTLIAYSTCHERKSYPHVVP